MKYRQNLFVIIKKIIKMFVPYGVLWLRGKLKSRPHQYLTRDYRTIYVLEFFITEKCNYKCEYCWFVPCQSNPVSASDAVINRFVKVLPKIRKNSYVKLIGGEAIVHPRFFELAKEVVKNKHTLAIQTNFSMPNKKFEEILDLIPENARMQMTISIHLSQIRSIDDFLNKIIDFYTYGKDKLDFSVCSVLKEDNFEILKKAYEKLKENNISFLFQRIRQGNVVASYSPKIEDYLKNLELESDSFALCEKLFSLKSYGLLCKAGHNMWRIRPDGRITRCFHDHKILFELGNLKTAFYALKKPLPCLRENCRCSFPIMLGMLTDEYDTALAKKIEKKYSSAP
jgi:MoaA/NifB/PqqE/SkfB family radical SAM enzyme